MQTWINAFPSPCIITCLFSFSMAPNKENNSYYNDNNNNNNNNNNTNKINEYNDNNQLIII